MNKHKEFLEMFNDKASFLFHPEKYIDKHVKNLENEYYTKDCMIEWLEHSPIEFTKKDCYQGIGLKRANKAFNTFWNFLIHSKNDYLHFTKETKTWTYFR